MTDTETRLRDYLHTQAATVPDDARGPGLEPAVHRRHWPVLTAAAAIAAVLVLTVTFLTRISSDRTAPVAPPGPVSAAAPKVPYIVYADNALHDGDQKVRLPKGVDTFSGRADGGWLGLQLPMEPRTRVGILQPNGGFRLLGPELSTGPTLSPDRTQVAMVHGLANRQAVVIVVDIASGQEVSRSPVLPAAPAKLVWNQTGIWLRTDEMVLAKLALWKPGSGSTKPVDVTGFDGGLSAPADGDTVVLSTRSGDRSCLRAGVLRADGFKQLREYCEAGAQTIYPLMSPDGRTVVNSRSRLVIDVPTGKVTKLQLPETGEVTDFPEPVFEDATQLIAIVMGPDTNTSKPPTQRVYRCDVRSGECALLLTGTGITLQTP
ncbi:hypothetical protein OHB24_25425 [Kribbella sp. NBC_00482]|uniref:hypothetical protein n=1 Tax=Kribbella sp. NBC_00482 TaxID=2975968 RepID=UPI002E19AB06